MADERERAVYMKLEALKDIRYNTFQIHMVVSSLFLEVARK